MGAAPNAIVPFEFILNAFFSAPESVLQPTHALSF